MQGFSDHWLETGMELDHSQYAEEVRYTHTCIRPTEEKLKLDH